MHFSIISEKKNLDLRLKLPIGMEIIRELHKGLKK